MSAFPAVSAALAGRVVLVSGASGGLGAACVEACAGAGATVVLLGRRVAPLEALYDRLLAVGAAQPAIYPLDLAGAAPDDYAELAGAIARDLGGLDAIVHAAVHFDGLAALSRVSPESWARTLHVGLTAPWWLTQACLPLLRRAERGALLFALDAPARAGRAPWGPYGVAKAGLERLVAMLREELAGTSVRVLALEPPPMPSGLRLKAYVGESPASLAAPAAVAAACVAALAADTVPADGPWR